MKTSHLIFIAALVPAVALPADASLFSFSMSGPLGKGGAQISMKFEEIDRTDGLSVVEVSGAPAGSDLSTGFLLNGMSGLARARTQRYFQARQIDADPLTFEVSFPLNAPGQRSQVLSGMAPDVFPVDRCPALTVSPRQ